MSDSDKNGKTQEKINDLELLNSTIRSRDKIALQKLLNEKTVKILDYHTDEWYPLHEAVDLGYVDIVKQIVAFATKQGINVLQKWDQAATTNSKYSRDWFTILFPREICPKTQTSFLRLAVRTGQIDMISFFLELYKTETKPNLSFRKRMRIRRLKVARISRTYLRTYIRTHITMNFSKNQGISEALFESISQPSILRLILETFPDYIVAPFDSCYVIQYALVKDELKSVSMLLPIFYTLHYDSKKAGYWGFACLMTMAEHCIKWTSEKNDTTVLEQFLEAGDAKRIINAKKIQTEYSTMYLLLYYSCCFGSVLTVQYLVEFGFNVYKESSPACVSMMSLRTKTDLHRMQPFDFIHAYYFRRCSCDPDDSFLDDDDDDDESSGRIHISALFWAALENNIDVLKYLLKIMDKDEFYKTHFCCPVMSQYIAVNSLHEPLRLLYEAGYHIDSFYPKILRSRPFLECCMFYNDKASMDTMKVLIKYGAVELTYGKDGSLALLKQSLEKQWHVFTQVFEGNLTEQTKYLVDLEDKLFCLNKFDVLLQHFGLFELVRAERISFEQTVPTLKQLCRYAIRSNVIWKNKTLIPLHDLPLPSSLADYLLSL